MKSFIIGVIFRKEHKNKCDYEYIPKEIFNNFRYYHHDDLPKDTDKFNEMIGFMKVAEEVAYFIYIS